MGVILKVVVVPIVIAIFAWMSYLTWYGLPDPSEFLGLKMTELSDAHLWLLTKLGAVFSAMAYASLAIVVTGTVYKPSHVGFWKGFRIALASSLIFCGVGWFAYRSYPGLPITDS